MYDEDCPICKVSSAFYKEEGKGSPNGKKYWRKKQHIVQALIVEDPLPADDDTGETHEGKVRFLALGYQLYNVIKDAFETDLENIPYLYEDGCNFIIKKTKNGDYDSYTVGSKFARKLTTLTEDEIALVEDNIVELKSLLPQAPEIEKVDSMLGSALTGAEYEDDASSSKPSVPDTQSDNKAFVKETKVEDVNQPETDDEYEDEADRMLAEIRKRKGNKA